MRKRKGYLLFGINPHESGSSRIPACRYVFDQVRNYVKNKTRAVE
jgi:hypothetical protein